MKNYYIHDGTQQMGPFDIEDLKLKNIHADTPIWYEGLKDWTTANLVEELKELLKNTTPPPFTKQSSTPPPIPTLETKNESTKSTLNLSGLSEYWIEEFNKINESKEIYKGKWNTWPFLFGGIWFFYKGAWQFGLALLLANIAIFKITNPLLGLLLYFIFLLYPGFKGNWIYYNVKIKNKQFPWA